MTGTPLPSAGYFNTGITNASAKDAFDQMLAFTRQSVMGAAVESTLTLASDVAIPTGTAHALDTEAAAATDNCTNLSVTNMISGQYLMIRAVNASHVVTLKHASTGSGQMYLSGSVDAVLDSTSKFILLRLLGTDWYEVFRSWSSASGGGISWTEVTGTSQSAAVDNGYIANNASLVTITLPTTAAVGKIVEAVGKGAGGWKIAQNASEIIHYGDISSTTGTGGSLASTHRRDCVRLICTVADTEWTVMSSQGTLDVV
jgi:hypothetical protein